MRAVVLAGGYGLRLRPLTRRRSAALLPVAGRPIVEYVLEHLVRYGVDTATVALHHEASQIERLLGDGTRAGLRLDYALERVPLGTGGAPRRVAAGWREPFVLAAATALVTTDLTKVIAFHREKRAILTLVCAAAESVAPELTIDDDGRAGAAFRPGTGMVWQGLALLDPRVLGFIEPGKPCDLIEDVLPRLRRAKKPAFGYVSAEPGLMIRTPGDLLGANRRAIAGDLPDLALPGFEVSPGVRLCRGARVHASARLTAPVLVGPNAVVGRGARIESSVLDEEVIVGAGSAVAGSVVLSRTHVGPSLSLREAIVDKETLGCVAGGPWVTVDDRRILGDTRRPVALAPVSLVGRLGAAALLGITAPAWLPCLTAVAAETGGRPFRSRVIVGARGRPVRVRRLAAHGPVGRCLGRLGLRRAPYLWSVVRGELHWMGTTPRTPAQTAALVGRGAEPPASRPGLVTLVHVVPLVLRWHDRLALDRLYAGTRTSLKDLRLLGSVLGRRVRSVLGAGASRPPS
jgi:NDP-sugar pyrophosphorylase family protein